MSAALPAVALDLAWAFRILWLAAIAASVIYSLRSNGVTCVRLQAGGSWQLILSDRIVEAELVGWFVQTWLCVLRFRCDGGRYTVALLPGSGRFAEQHRRLRSALLLGARAASSAPEP